MVAPVNPRTEKWPETGELVAWYDASQMPIEGKGWTDTASPFDRLPARAQKLVRPIIWDISRNSAGLLVRFESDATRILARWTLRGDQLAMPHMPATGVSGLDLYASDSEGRQRWAGVGRPLARRAEGVLADGLFPGARQFALYLPLYNGVQSLEIGVAPEASLTPLAPQGGQPIVYYGTSIVQGGCASRPGMCHAAILGRRLGRTVVNLGFSGNAIMEPEVAALLAELDPALYVVDALPNMDAGAIRARAEAFIRTLCTAHRATPIVLVEDRTYADSWVTIVREERNRASREAFREVYRRLMADGITGLCYVGGDGLLGDDSEGTVDCSHPTDLGFWRMADALEPALRRALDAQL